METILKIKNISKSFPGVKAVEDVSISFNKGEVHAIVGENGAGKSTLMKVLSGVYQPESGEIFVNDREVAMSGVHEARVNGISIIFQEFNLLYNASIEDNIFLNQEKGKFGFIDTRLQHRMVSSTLEALGISLNPNTLVCDLSVVQQQLVEIAKALISNAEIIIMDEPTATLTDREIRKLFKVVRTLTSQGISIIFISHIIEEVFEIANKISVMKDGHLMGTYLSHEVTKDKVIELMVGRKLEDIYPPIASIEDATIDKDEAVFSVKDLSLGEGITQRINFALHKGEVLGIAGMVGAGQIQLAEVISGIRHHDSGTIILDGKITNYKNVRQALNAGIVYISEDRKAEGIIAQMNIMVNTTLTVLHNYLCFGLLRSKKEERDTAEQVDLLRVKTAGPETLIGNLSGGNQQKVIFGRGLLVAPKVMIIVEPTRGIDIGAKSEIYKIIRGLTDEGKSIIMVSSELNELIGMSNRIIVMRNGRIAGVISQKEKRSTEQEILSLAVGHTFTFKEYTS